MRRHPWRIAALCAGLQLLGACAGSVSPSSPVSRSASCPMGETAQQDIRLFFGLTKLDGSAIGNADWASFLAETVTPRFPDGLTLYETAGQWRDRTGDRIVRQPSRVIEIVSPPGARAQSAIEAIRSAYRSRFNQQSVGLVISTACASF